MDEKRYIGFEIRSLDRMIGRQSERITQDHLEGNIPAQGGWIIGFLYRHSDQPIYQKDIEHKFCMPPSTVTKILKELEKNGYITRTAVENDARLKRLILTEKGKELHTGIMHTIHEKIDDQLTAGLTETDLVHLYEMIDTMKRNAQSLGEGMCSQTK